MHLEKEHLARYGQEIGSLYQKELHESPTNGLVYFGIFDGDILKAVAAIRCYMGSWYLRACVVKPKFRGQGLQRQLIRERLDYLSERTNLVRVSVHPGNIHSIQNIEAEGFEFEKKKKLKDGGLVLVYRKRLTPLPRQG
jgi:ribosomal protein S18 acetylase RimI-like enzyme